jgi:hypothetical protein
MTKLIELDIALKFATNMYKKYYDELIYAYSSGNISEQDDYRELTYDWTLILVKIEAEMKQIIESNYPN